MFSSPKKEPFAFNPIPMRFLIVVLFVCINMGCSTTKKEDAATDTTRIEKAPVVDSTTAITRSPTPNTPTKASIQNFYGYLNYAITEDEHESRIWNILGPLIQQYDTTEFNSISKNYTMPGTEETADETLNTSTTVTVTLYYNDAQELKAVWREYKYEIGDADRFEKITTLYLFDEDLIAFYEDKEVSLDMAFQNYTRGIVNACPDCGITMSAGVSSNEVTVTGILSADAFVSSTKAARKEELLLEYAYADSFQASGDDYTYQTVEPLNQEADYDVFYTANKGYYEKFMKPKLRN
jgi:hypothetical protein